MKKRTRKRDARLRPLGRTSNVPDLDQQEAEFQAFLSLYVPRMRASFLKARAVLPAPGPMQGEGSRAWQLTLTEVANKMEGAHFFYPPFWQQLSGRMFYASHPNAPFTRPRLRAQLIANGQSPDLAAMILSHTDSKARRLLADRLREEVTTFFRRALSRRGVRKAKSDELAELVTDYLMVPVSERLAWKRQEWGRRGFSSLGAMTDALKPHARKKAGLEGS
jgi:hypothetical protein